MSNKAHATHTASEILSQLGGHRFMAMTGSKNPTVIREGESLGLQLNLGRNATSANRMRIILDANDTYTVSFERHTFSRKTLEAKNKIITKVSGIYCDMLEALFTETTKLYTRI